MSATSRGEAPGTPEIICIGEILWDVFDDAELIGGATFNFAAHAARLGHQVTLISAVGKDERGRRALKRAAELGLPDRYVRVADAHPTGHVTVFLDDEGQPDFTIHRPAAYDMVRIEDRDLEELAALGPDWIYFGTLHQMNDNSRSQTQRLLDAIPDARRFYDINLRKESHTPSLIEDLLSQATILKINDEEVRMVEEMFGQAHVSMKGFAERAAELYGLEAVCITKGDKGSALLLDGNFTDAPGYPVRVADAVGAGDAFGAAFIHGLSQGGPPDQVIDFANRVGALIASKGGAVPEWTVEEAEALAAG